MSEELEGRRILLVEDDYFQAREMKALLEREGAEIVGPTGHADDVPALLADGAIDAALLDINLGAGPVYDTANLLKRQGVPVAFLTGYDQALIPESLTSVPRILKPADGRKVILLLQSLF